MKSVSVIVPAYNAHDTLARCLGSLVNQTLQDIEIIVINDASTDDTWEIMQRCEEQFPDKVMIINGERNLGPGGARNQGLDHASGEYIGFVDSDDYVSQNMYELLYKRATETEADIVDSGFYSEETDTALLTASDDLTGMLDDNKRSKLIVSGGYLVTKIFRRELFNEPLIRMRENVTVLEDLEILVYMYLRASRLETVKEIFYCYCNTNGSGSKTVDLARYYNAVTGAMNSLFETCSAMPAYCGCREAIEFMLTKLYSYGVNRCLYDNIKKYGASTKNIQYYFDHAGSEEIRLMRELSELKSKVVFLDYNDNQYVRGKMSELDIGIMKECDRRYPED